MPNAIERPRGTNRVLVKVRVSNALKAAESRANLRPLYETPAPVAGPAFGISGNEPQWFLADLAGDGPSPWDLAHARVADQLGIDESDVVFAEPDLVNDIYPDPDPTASDGRLAIGGKCEANAQDGQNGNAIGPHVGWHLDDSFSELAKARGAVAFTDPRTRIGHLDTGYYRAHITVPRHVRQDLERNFVERDGNQGSAEDPDNKLLVLDNSGHGTGTLSILAGGGAPGLGATGMDMGGAPEAEIVPVRIADSVVLLHTSAFARGLRHAVDNRCDVISMSMGGVPSEAWREAVDRAYLSGVCVVTASGNNFGGLPTRHVVYPARYGRVIAACGVMANGRPYAHLQHRTMEGNFGPGKIMGHALAAYTPNIPWAMFGCPDVIRWNGGGTSSATPQIAAAVALWFEKYKNELPRDWRRVEAVRKALFSTAAKSDPDELGNGVLRAAAALEVRPDLTLKQTKSDGDSFAFLRVITGLGITEASTRERMFNLEIAQRWLLNPEMQAVVPEPDIEEPLDDASLRRFMELVIEDPKTSVALRKHIEARYVTIVGPSDAGRPRLVKPDQPEVRPVFEVQPPIPEPPCRRLHVYAVDPSLSMRLATAGVNDVALRIRWESLEPGPVGEYLEVVDEPVANKANPVNLDDPRLLAQDGWVPSEGNPQFHQQMVYAVAMRTIEQFERALGRPMLWRPGKNPKDANDDSLFVKRLKVRPHAFKQANAYYSPEEIALQFGYIKTEAAALGDQVPGTRVYTCLSHDIIAHETTHAILDGMHRYFNQPTNPDVLALHEAFADLVALLQHFTIPEVLELEIARTRGDIEAESILGSLAVQFGRALGGRGALRDAIGKVEDGVWKRLVTDPGELDRRVSPHSRGAILVAAVFDAFIAIYKTRTRDLLRIYTGGTGILPGGAIHPDLVGRLTEEATTSARHVLNMCIRAIDYLPPVDVTFFEYLRAVITADADLVADDRYNYRLAFVEAFRRRGIYPTDATMPEEKRLRGVSVDTVRWEGIDYSRLEPTVQKAIKTQYGAVISRLKRYADTCLYMRRRDTLFERTRQERRALHEKLVKTFQAVPEFAREMGLDPARSFEVHELRAAMRSNPTGRYIPQVIVALTQWTPIATDAATKTPEHVFRGGATLVVDLSVPEVKYCIGKNIASVARRARTADFIRETAADPLRALLFAPDRPEPFAALHALADEGL